MKKTLVILLILFLVIIVVATVAITNYRKDQDQVKQFNKEYEYYTGVNLFGTDVATVINKATSHNEKNHIEKDSNGFYIDDGKTMIEVEVKFTMNDKIYKMENISKLGIESFVDSYNLASFKSTEIKYHETTGQISKIVFEQLPEELAE